MLKIKTFLTKIKPGIVVKLCVFIAVLISVHSITVVYPQSGPIVSYIKNPHLKSILSTDVWQGNPVDDNNRFINPEYPFKPSMMKGLRFLLGKNPEKKLKKKDIYQLPVEKDTSFLYNNKDVIVWLGHASFFIRINGINILTDPVFFNSGTAKRKSPMPFDANLLHNIDYILISHDHRDHLDKKSIQLIFRNCRHPEILAGLRMDEWLNKMVKNPKIQTAGWYQQYVTDTSKIKIFFMPARHWSRRHIWDTNKHLWGSFVVEADGKKIFFGGDSGYGSHFKQIGEIFNGIDICILGIGTFKPEWFMSENHTSPADAATASNDLKAKKFIPMHYGTFDFSYEPMGEPVETIKNEKQRNKLNADLIVLPAGKNYYFDLK